MDSEKGNVLFLVLLAVVLFTALSFAVTNVSRGGNHSIQHEMSSAHTSALVQYTTYLSQSITKMRIAGVSAEELCFDSPLWEDDLYYYEACDNVKNRVFSSENGGGGITLMAPPLPLVEKEGKGKGQNSGGSIVSPLPGASSQAALPWVITGQSCIIDAAQECHSNGAADDDLIIFLPDITLTDCIEIDKRLGVPLVNGVPPKASGTLWPNKDAEFKGVFKDGGRIDSGGNGDLAILTNYHVGCVEGGGGATPAGKYCFFHVLYTR